MNKRREEIMDELGMILTDFISDGGMREGMRLELTNVLAKAFDFGFDTGVKESFDRVRIEMERGFDDVRRRIDHAAQCVTD